MKSKRAATIMEIDKCLPQTQCRLCGYPDCQSYARAIAKGEHLHLCQPGGKRTLKALEQVCNRKAESLPTEYRTHKVIIDETLCIGCYKCVTSCPVSAIVGAAKNMHTVIISDCTGCDLCVPVCPVDCIYPTESYDPPHYSHKALTEIWRARKDRYEQKRRPQESQRTQTASNIKRTRNAHKQHLGRKNYQIARVQKAIAACQKKGYTSQLVKLEQQLQLLQSNQNG